MEERKVAQKKNIKKAYGERGMKQATWRMGYSKQPNLETKNN